MDDFGTQHIYDMGVITYHVWWPGYNDPFWQADSVENKARTNYYSINSTPDFKMDGSEGGSPGSWAGLLASRLAVSAPVTIDLSGTYDSGTRSGVVTAVIHNVSSSSISANCRMAVTESEINWHAPNGINVHNYTMRDMLPDATGASLNLAAGASTTVNQSYTLNAGWDMDNCQLVCFVQNATKEVLQVKRLFFPIDQPHLFVAGTTQAVLPGGDGDAYLDPNESASVVVTLTNQNQGTALGTSAVLSSDDPYVTVTQGSASFGDIPGFSTASNSGNPFQVAVSPRAPRGYQPQLSLAVTSGSLLYTTTLDVTVNVGSPTDWIGPIGVYYAYEDADAPCIQNPSYYNGADSAWVEISTTKGGSGTRIAYGDDVSAKTWIGFPFKFYGTTSDTAQVCSNGWISLSTILRSDSGPLFLPTADAPPSLIAGLWDDLDPRTTTGTGQIYYYRDTPNHRFIVEYDGVDHFGQSGTNEYFEMILLDPAYYHTSTGDGIVLVVYRDMALPTSGGAGIQNSTGTVGINYELWGVPNPAAVGIADRRVVKYSPDSPPTDVARPGSPNGPALLLAASPNPFSGSTEIAFRLPSDQHARVEIYGVDGRSVATLFNQTAGAGMHTVRWDGHDAGGHLRPAGLYFVRLETAGSVETGKVMLLH